MQIPSNVKPLLQGAAVSAFVTTGIIFYGFAMTNGNAEALAKETAKAEVVAALVPFCVLNFQGEQDAPARLTELRAASSWQQGSFVEKAGWATMPGAEKPNSAVAKACAMELIKAAS